MDLYDYENKIIKKKHSHCEVIHEAFPARRPFQKVIHASLDVGAGEDWTDPGAVHRHPHGHPGMR